MKSYKNENYEQALIETILKFDELLKNEKINEYLKSYSKRRAQNNNTNFNLEILNKNTLIENNIEQNLESVDNNNIIKNNNGNKSDYPEKEIADFDNEFNKICEKIKNDCEIFSFAFEDKMKLKILENDFDGILEYFNSKSKSKKEKLEKHKISKSLSIEKLNFTSKE